jgi:hypothetical protein
LIEPLQAMVEACLRRVGPLAEDLRRDGWDASLIVHAEPEAVAVVEVVVRVAVERVPVEAGS